MKLVSQAILVAAMVAAVAGGLYLVARSPTSGGGVEVLLPAATAERVVELKVYLTGAVRNPGVYTVEQGSRLGQVVQAAGGATEDADLAAVNLAARVSDEDHWHVPRQGEEAQPQQAPSSASSRKINLNQADAALLKSLPGIGDVKAQAIISYRQANGPFPNVNDVLEVSGIGAATLNGIRDLVEVR